MTMTNDQAIAYLAEMDREINVLLQARRAGQQISEVLQHFQKRSKELEALVSQESKLREEITNFEKVHQTEVARLHSQLVTAEKEADAELATINKRMVQARSELTKIEDSLRDKQGFFQTRSAQMDTEINDKAEALRRLEAGIHEFKQRHGLA